MSLLKAIKAQLGLSNTPANNFTITAEADNGTLKLARGNAGATTQDILTVAANGVVDLPVLARQLNEAGYVTLPSGLIIQWGYSTLNTSAANAWVTIAATYPKAFPTAVLGIIGSANNGPALSQQAIVGAAQVSSLSQCTVGALSAGSAVSGIRVSFIAIGY